MSEVAEVVVLVKRDSNFEILITNMVLSDDLEQIEELVDSLAL